MKGRLLKMSLVKVGLAKVGLAKGRAPNGDSLFCYRMVGPLFGLLLYPPLFILFTPGGV